MNPALGRSSGCLVTAPWFPLVLLPLLLPDCKKAPVEAAGPSQTCRTGPTRQALCSNNKQQAERKKERQRWIKQCVAFREEEVDEKEEAISAEVLLRSRAAQVKVCN